MQRWGKVAEKKKKKQLIREGSVLTVHVGNCLNKHLHQKSYWHKGCSRLGQQPLHKYFSTIRKSKVTYSHLNYNEVSFTLCYQISQWICIKSEYVYILGLVCILLIFHIEAGVFCDRNLHTLKLQHRKFPPTCYYVLSYCQQYKNTYLAFDICGQDLKQLNLKWDPKSNISQQCLQNLR